MTAASVARVVVDSPLPQLDQLFDYRVPENLRDQVRAGQRVRVPLRAGNRIAHGWIVELTDSSEFGGRLSDLHDVVSTVPLLRPEVWTLARAVADRSAGTASDVLRLAIPGRYVRAERAWNEADPDPGPLPESTAITGFSAGQVEGGIDDGARMALQVDPRPVRLPSGDSVGAWAVTMAELAAYTLAADRSALLIVPDYRDQEQLELALVSLIDERRILRTDARQTGGVRFRAFLDAAGDASRVIIGNRSTVYSPASRLGLIAMWDDGDPVLAEPLAPGVHPRDAALVRREQSGAALAFLSHTRSVEVQRLVAIGWVREATVGRHSRPRVVLSAEQPSDGLAAARIPPAAWRDAQQALESGPVLVQVARPGHAPLLVCDRCREPAQCRVCSGALVVPREGGGARCALCNAAAGSWQCGVCQATKLRAVTIGASRTAEQLGRAFPRAKIVLSDGERTITRVANESALVIATRGAEPVAEGGYHAVLLLDGERMLLRESLRVAEDCLRWWANAAALAVPGAPVHLVGVHGRLAQTLATWQHTAWAAEELEARRELRFPPAVRVASVTASHERLARALEAVRTATPAADTLGPTPVDDGLERAIVRFDYVNGAAVATTLRAEMVRVSTERRKPVGGRARRPGVLRVRFDDPQVP